MTASPEPAMERPVALVATADLIDQISELAGHLNARPGTLAGVDCKVRSP